MYYISWSTRWYNSNLVTLPYPYGIARWRFSITRRQKQQQDTRWQLGGTSTGDHWRRSTIYHDRHGEYPIQYRLLAGFVLHVTAAADMQLGAALCLVFSSRRPSLDEPCRQSSIASLLFSCTRVSLLTFSSQPYTHSLPHAASSRLQPWAAVAPRRTRARERGTMRLKPSSRRTA